MCDQISCSDSVFGKYEKNVFGMFSFMSNVWNENSRRIEINH